MIKEENSVALVRTVAAPIEQVYEAWTKPDLLQQWFAPRGSAVRSADVALHEGGTYRVEVIDSDWNRHVTDGRYEELVPNRSIVKTLAHDGPGVRSGVGAMRVDVNFQLSGGNDRFWPATYLTDWEPVRFIADRVNAPYNRADFDAEARRELEAEQRREQQRQQ